MFTGLITDIGEVRRVRQSGENWTLEIGTSYATADLELGESIAVDGACLTVTTILDDAFTIDASPETLRRTTLGDRKVGHKVHLERAMALGDRMGGHMVLGHVDAVGVVKRVSHEKNAVLIEVDAPPQVAEFLIEKGSVTMDGVSLTVNSVSEARFGLAIIPFTTEKTNLASYRVGQRVNLEADILGKYVKKLLGGRTSGVLNDDFLAAHGFSND